MKNTCGQPTRRFQWQTWLLSDLKTHPAKQGEGCENESESDKTEVRKKVELEL